MKNDKKALILEAVSRVMRPLAQLLMAYGLSYREFTELSKTVFYKAGTRMLLSKNPAAKITDSQLSILTGLHRKDITVFRQDNTKTSPASESNHSPGAAIIAEWITNPKYLQKDGKPKPLPYSAPKSEASFSMLVESTSKDIRPKAHLEELTRLNLVNLDATQLVHLKQDAFIPSQDLQKKLEFFTRNIGDHLSASAENIEKNASFFDRSAFHDNLDEDAIKELRKMADEGGMELLKKIYRRAEELAKTKKSKPKSTPLQRMTLGVYLYHTEDKDDEAK